MEMPKNLVQFLLGGQTCVVATVDAKCSPSTTVMSWAVARNPQTLTLAVDLRSTSLQNIRQNGRIALEVLGDDLCYGLRGSAVIEKETMASTPFPCALVAVRIEDVGPRYSFHAGKEHRKGLEEAVFAELKGPAPTI
jgi:hypothetical protein